MDNSKNGRNSVDVFSDYGLDERQRSTQYNIGFRCFKEFYAAVLILTGLWIVLEVFADLTFSALAVAGSYFVAAEIFYCTYSLRAAKLGVINGITAFSFSVMKLASAIFCLIMTAIFAMGAAGILSAFEDKPNTAILAVICAAGAMENFVLYFCGRKNDRTLDEQNIEEENDE